ncbi:hypothetical protein GCM10020370_70580 [Paenibacillus hodogayensis]
MTGPEPDSEEDEIMKLEEWQCGKALHGLYLLELVGDYHRWVYRDRAVS